MVAFDTRYSCHFVQRSSIPFSPNPDKLPPEITNGRDAGESKDDYRIDIDRTSNSEQANNQEAEL